MTKAPDARPSATVVLAREADAAPELLMMRRHEKSSFGGAYAFPGGVIDDADRSVADHCHGISVMQADALLGVDHALDYFSGAIRELFEESGVLLADVGDDDIDLDAARDGLNLGRVGWDAFVIGNNLHLRCDVLHYFSFWITPAALPTRYATRFFLTEMPAGQAALHCGGELTDSCWVTAEQALRSERSGSMSMHFPTIRTLETLAEHESLDGLLQWARAREEKGVPCIFPEIGECDGERRVIIGGKDAGPLK